MEYGGRADGEPGGPPRFLADAMLGRLATWLRILGYDAEYSRAEDDLLLRRAHAEGRILLTRDTGLLRRPSEGVRNPADRLPSRVFIQSDRVTEQIRQLAQSLALDLSAPPTRRCARCNVVLESRTKAAVADRVPEFIWSHHDTFWGCPNCGRIYWAGSHRRRMDETIRALGAPGQAPRTSTTD
jgi:hypothetical protein